MNQPSALANEEGMGLIDSKVVHALIGMVNHMSRIHNPIAAIFGADVHPSDQVFGIDPLAILGVEGMLRSCVDGIAINVQFNDGVIGVVDGVGDSLRSDLAS